jgi:hypothetical protein
LQEDGFRLLVLIVLTGALYLFLELAQLARDLEEFLATRGRRSPPAVPGQSEKSQPDNNPEESAATA